MSLEKIKAFVCEYVEKVWNQGDLIALDNMTTATFIYQLGGQPPRDRISMQHFIAMTHTAFPDWQVQVVDIIAENDKVTIRWEGRVTHQGAFHNISPTNKRITVSGINIYHIINGKIAAEYEQTDSLGMLQQMGVLPAS